MAVAFYEIDDQGITDYNQSYYTQLDVVHQKKRSDYYPDRLILVEHPQVYTFGRKSRGVIPWDLKNAYAIERGGEATYHNLGQLVSYPILTLREGEKDAHLHLRRLEETLIQVLKEFEIICERRPGATGVWVVGKTKKIASIGIAISSWITFHGAALNINNDLSGFLKIDPCGFNATVMTSMKEELKERCPSIADVKKVFITHFSKQFNRLPQEASAGAKISRPMNSEKLIRDTEKPIME
ncbi:MAG: lipoyl(octanoyl) transferase LipB [Deltaproteobacteria bacterium]|nr:lipoyl(octanoyl) transferase LipB [Deltaproteobacteria bacterium]